MHFILSHMEKRTSVRMCILIQADTEIKPIRKTFCTLENVLMTGTTYLFLQFIIIISWWEIKILVKSQHLGCFS